MCRMGVTHVMVISHLNSAAVEHSPPRGRLICHAGLAKQGMPVTVDT